MHLPRQVSLSSHVMAAAPGITVQTVLTSRNIRYFSIYYVVFHHAVFT
jgi:hypothetical protein